MKQSILYSAAEGGSLECLKYESLLISLCFVIFLCISCLSLFSLFFSVGLIFTKVYNCEGMQVESKSLLSSCTQWAFALFKVYIFYISFRYIHT